MASTFITLPTSNISGPIDVVISATNDSIKVSDGTNTLAVNPDGSINVAGTSLGTVVLTGVNEFEYDEVSSIAVGGSAIIVSRLFSTEYKLRRVSATGTNIAVYTILFDGSPVDKKRSTYSDFNCEFDYETGITVPAGTTVTVEVENASPTSPGDFSARLLFSAE